MLTSLSINSRYRLFSVYFSFQLFLYKHVEQLLHLYFKVKYVSHSSFIAILPG